MSDISPTELGRQLMKPTGENGLKIAENMNVTNSKIYDFVLAQLKINDDDKLLEIGFGNGKKIPSLFLLNPNFQYYGIDFSELMCAEAFVFNSENKNVTISCQDAMEMSFEANFFDCIVTINTIYFWANIVKQLKELKRVLRKGGKLFIGYRPESSMTKLPFTKEVFNHYSAQDLKIIFEQNGFKILADNLQSTIVKSVDGSMIEMEEHCLIAENI